MGPGSETSLAFVVTLWLLPQLLLGLFAGRWWVAAGELLGARTVVPIHYGGFAIDPFYRPVADPSARFEQAAVGRPYVTRVLEPGESFASVSDAVAG